GGVCGGREQVRSGEVESGVFFAAEGFSGRGVAAGNRGGDWAVLFAVWGDAVESLALPAREQCERDGCDRLEESEYAGEWKHSGVPGEVCPEAGAGDERVSECDV